MTILRSLTCEYVTLSLAWLPFITAIFYVSIIKSVFFFDMTLETFDIFAPLQYQIKLEKYIFLYLCEKIFCFRYVTQQPKKSISR